MSCGDPAATFLGATLRWEWALKEDQLRRFFKCALALRIRP